MDQSRRIVTAGISLIAVVIALIIFTVLVYNGKRMTSDDLDDGYPKTVSSQPGNVSGSDVSDAAVSDVSAEEVSSTPVSSEEVSSQEPVSLTTDVKKNKSENIICPDYKSPYYMVVFTGSQSIMVYKKDAKGGYTIKFMNMRCSVGTLPVTTSDDLVYRIEKKEKWSEIGGGMFGQYACLISEKDGLYISSAPFEEKKPSTLVEAEYDKLGQATENAGIQLCVRDAHWVHLNMPVGTQISVVNDEGPETREMTKRKTAAKYSGWDPTDKWSGGNPYFASSTTKAASGTGEAG